MHTRSSLLPLALLPFALLGACATTPSGSEENAEDSSEDSSDTTGYATPEEHGAARFHERLSESWITMAEKLTRFEASPSPLRLPGIFWEALRG